MIDDLDERLKNIGSRMEKTIVFAKSIKEANIISNYINRKYNNGEE
jgi:type I site-specific restriction endonuclease